MDLITALAVSIGALGAVATYVFLGFLPGLHLWAAFIAWASFYGCGGKQAGLTSSIVGNIFGAFCALIALLLVTKILPSSLGNFGPALAVGVTVVVLVLAAKVPALSAIPASVYGYASTAAVFLMGKATPESLTEASLANPFVAIVISMIIGNIFGFVSEMVAGQLTSK